MNNNEEINWLILDWGTTNLRVFAMSDNGALIDKREHKLGILHVQNGNFATELEVILRQWLVKFEHLPIYMAGMVGSAQGWVNVPYATAPVKLENLAAGAKQFTLPWGASATVIPGVCHRDDDGNYEVMRGEEVQLFGLIELTGKTTLEAAFPGTHCKHVSLTNNTLTSFKTYMTGELFSVISENTILGRGLPAQEPSNRGFERGILESEAAYLTNQLFKARTHRLFGVLEESEIHEYISGLLIGNEVRALSLQHIYLVGSKTLCNRYSKTCRVLNKTSEYVNADDCFIAGMLRIKRVMSNECI